MYNDQYFNNFANNTRNKPVVNVFGLLYNM